MEGPDTPQGVAELAAPRTVRQDPRKRRRLMDDWAAFLARPELPAQVIDLHAKRG
jgi:hypothetical protein